MASSNDIELLVRRASLSSALLVLLGCRFTFFHELDREWGAERDVDEQWSGALSPHRPDPVVAIRQQRKSKSSTLNWTA